MLACWQLRWRENSAWRLVIGNAQYAHAPRLANPLNDIADSSAALARLGFSFTELENANYAAFRRALPSFTRAASAADVAAVFYASHDIDMDQRNLLVPVDAGVELSRADRRLVQLGLVAEGLDPGPADGLFGRANE